MSRNQLTIIIPYFKACFLDQTLDSLRRQSCRDFELVVGDDCSPEDPSEILGAYGDLNPRYVRFPENLGRHRPARHWNRCVSLASSRWIWLFSDDDLVSGDAVERALATIREVPATRELLRLQSSMIDREGKVVGRNPLHPPWEEAIDFATSRFCTKRQYFIQDHIFSREAFDREGGFVDYPKGMFSDDATWYRFGKRGGVTTVPGAHFYWRMSPHQFSAPSSDGCDAKLEAFARYCADLMPEVRRLRPSELPAVGVGAVAWLFEALPVMGGRPGLRSIVRVMLAVAGLSPSHVYVVTRRLLAMRRADAGVS